MKTSILLSNISDVINSTGLNKKIVLLISDIDFLNPLPSKLHVHAKHNDESVFSIPSTSLMNLNTEYFFSWKITKSMNIDNDSLKSSHIKCIVMS